MIIYFEGVDGSGKTTLKNAVVERLNQLKQIKQIEVVKDGELLIPTHPKRPGRLDAETLIDKLYFMATDLDTVYIVDRGPISDVIYRTYDEYKPIINIGTFWSFVISHIHLITIVFCDSDASEELMIARGDDNPIAYEKHKELRYIYKQIMSMFAHTKYDVKTMGDNLEHRVNVILAMLWQGLEKYNQLTEMRNKLKEEQSEQISIFDEEEKVNE